MKIIFKDVSFYYKRGNIKTEEVLGKINLEFAEGESYLLTGRCGSGKTTLAMLLKGLLLPTSGKVFLNNSSSTLSSFQRSIGFVFQYPEEQFFKETIGEEVAFGPLMLGLARIRERVRDSVNRVGLSYEKLKKRSPFDLSSGEQRRLAIASIIACEPSWYIFDEPTAGLDWEGRLKIVNLIKHLSKERKTVIIISQELELFLEISDEIIVLANGRLKLKSDKKTFLEKEELNEMENLLPYHIRVLRILRQRGWNIPVAITDPHRAAIMIDEYKM